MGDQDFLEKLYISCSEIMKATAYKTLICSEQAGECVTDAFILAANKIEELRRHPNPGGWLVLSTRNIALCFNRDYRKASYVEIPINYNLITVTNSTNEQSILEQFECKVFADFDKITENIIEKVLSQSEIVLYNLYYRKKMRLKDVAGEMGLKFSTVKMRKMKMDKKLKVHALELCEDDSFWEKQKKIDEKGNLQLT